MTPVDFYCERTTPLFWAEPVNALSNLAFIVTAVAAFALWKRIGKGDRAILALIILIAAIGVGSFTFHTVATYEVMWLDTGPIALFIYAYLLLAMRRFLLFSWLAATWFLLTFIAISVYAGSLPNDVLNGSAGYLPALMVLITFGLMLHDKTGRTLLVAAAIFAVAVSLRTLDMAVCPTWPLGTHFAWHLLNALVLYIIIRAALMQQKQVLTSS